MSRPSTGTVQDAGRLDALRRTRLLDSAPEEAFDRLTRMAASALRVPLAYVSLVDEDRQFFKSHCGLSEPLATTRETPLTHSFCRHAVESREPLVVADAREHPVLRHNPAVDEHGFVAYAGIPLITTAGHALGAFCVVERRPHAWSEREIEILSALARSAVSEIELRGLADELRRLNSDLQELVESRTVELRSAEERRRVLLEVNNAVVTCRDRDSLFEAASAAVHRVVSFDRAALMLHDAARNVFTAIRLAAATMTSAAAPVGAEWPRENSRAGWVLEHGRTLLTADLRVAPPFVEHELLLEEGILSVVSVPMSTKGKIVGTLNVGSRVAGRYDEGDASLLLVIGEQLALAIDNLLAYEEIASLKARLEQENLYLQEEVRAESAFGEVVGESSGIRGALARVRKVADTDATVLVTGETGTGKELIVRAIHDRSRRKDKLLVKVNCAALPSTLIESELFGHEKGAFTGAIARKIGRFELAHEGTLFLDEVGDLPLELQAKLLRVLQEGEFERIGGTHTLKVQVRVVAATNRDLASAVAEGRFRADLFYRLNVFPIHLPPLRERADDVPRLVRHFVALHAARMGKQIAPPDDDVMQRLRAYSWPGNIRELQNVVERAVILAKDGRLDVADLGTAVTAPNAPLAPRTLADVDRAHIVSVLRETGWRVSGPRGAAQILGLKRTTLEARMKRLGIARRA